MFYAQEFKSESADLVTSIITTQNGLDTKLEKSQLKIFSDSKPIVSSEFKDIDNPVDTSTDVREKENGDSSDEEDNGENESQNYVVENVEEDGRIRRKVVFPEKDDEGSDSSDDDDDESNASFGNLEGDQGSDSAEDLDANTDEDNDLEVDSSIKKSEVSDGQRIKKDEKADYIKTKISNVLKKLEDRDASIKKNNLKSTDENVNKGDVEGGNGIYEEDSDYVDDDEEEETEEEEEDDKEDKVAETTENSSKRKFSESGNNEEADQSGSKRHKVDTSEENDFESSAVKWKEKLAEKALSAFIERQNNTQNLYKLVYGKCIMIFTYYYNTFPDL